MESGQSSGEAMKKRMSLGLNVADEKIKLIDVLCEDDYFLVPSLQSSISELERTERKEERMHVQEKSRPSFLRRSLAWDSAFFDNSGVLDADELFYINIGANETSLLPANHEVRNRRSESEDDAGFSADWFEIQPSFFEYKPSKASNVAERSSKSGLKQNLQSLKKVDRTSISKATINTYQTSTGKRMGLHSQSKPKKEKNTSRQHIWVAQGLVAREFVGEEERKDEVARDYLNELISRNMVQVQEMDKCGDVKLCQMHDLLRDLSIRKAEEEMDFEVLRLKQGSSSPPNKINISALCSSI